MTYPFIIAMTGELQLEDMNQLYYLILYSATVGCCNLQEIQAWK